MRSVNRSMLVIGAPLGGGVADHLGCEPALCRSPFGRARMPDDA
jgi:hypothetical protein